MINKAQSFVVFKGRLRINKSILGKGGVFLVANILNAMIPFLLLPILTRVLTPSDYGVVAMFAIFLAFTNTLVGLSVHGAINVQYFKMDTVRFSQYLTGCLLLLISSEIFVFLLVLLFGAYFEDLIGIPYKWMLIGVITSFFQFLITIRLATWVVLGNAFHYGVFQVSNTSLNTIISLALIFMLGLTWTGRLLGQVIAIVIFGVIAFVLLTKQGLVKKAIYWKIDMVDALKFGIPLIPHTIGAFVIYNVDRAILSNTLGVASVGIYMVAIQLGQVMGLVVESYNKVYSPWLMKELTNTDVNKEKIVMYSYFSMFIIVGFGVIWSIVARFLLPIVAGREFQEASSLIFYTSMGFSLTGLYYLVTNYIFYAKKTKLLAMITFFCALINIPLAYMFIHFYGLKGAGIGFVLIQLLFFLMTWMLAAKVHPMPWLYFLKGKENA